MANLPIEKFKVPRTDDPKEIDHWRLLVTQQLNQVATSVSLTNPLTGAVTFPPVVGTTSLPDTYVPYTGANKPIDINTQQIYASGDQPTIVGQYGSTIGIEVIDSALSPLKLTMGSNVYLGQYGILMGIDAGGAYTHFRQIGDSLVLDTLTASGGVGSNAEGKLAVVPGSVSIIAADTDLGASSLSIYSTGNSDWSCNGGLGTVAINGKVTAISYNGFNPANFIIGPASVTSNNVVFFDGVTGKLVKDSGLTLSGSNTGDQITPSTPTVPSHYWLKSYDSSTGLFGSGQVDYSDLTGTPSLPITPTVPSHYWLKSYDSSTGLFGSGQVDYSDLTGTPSLAGYVPYTGATADVDLGAHNLTAATGYVSVNQAIIDGSLSAVNSAQLFMRGNKDTNGNYAGLNMKSLAGSKPGWDVFVTDDGASDVAYVIAHAHNDAPDGTGFVSIWANHTVQLSTLGVSGIVYNDVNGKLATDTSNLLYEPAAYSGGPHIEFGPGASNPDDATFEVYNATPGQSVAHFHQTGAQGPTTGGAIVNLMSADTTAMLSGACLGTIQFAGSKDTSQTPGIGASISAYATENFGATATGGELVFKVVGNTTTTPVAALTLNQDMSATFAGGVGIGGLLDIAYTDSSEKMVLRNTTAATLGVPQSSPQFNLKGSLWNSALGAKAMAGGLQLITYASNVNPTIAALGFCVGAEGAAPTLQGLINSNGMLASYGGADFVSTSKNDNYNVKIRNSAAATNSVPQNSNKLVFEGRAWNSFSGSIQNQSYIQLLCTVNNYNPFTERLGFFTQAGTSGGAYTEQMSISNNGIIAMLGNVASTSTTTGTLVATGGVGISGALFVGTTIVATAGFGCNAKTAQTAYASGGALSAYSTGAYGYDTAAHAQEIHDLLVNIRAALVNCGLMS